MKYQFFRIVKDVVGSPLELSPADCGWINGYSFGDRLLEGVMFKISVKDEELVAEISPTCAAYFNELNSAYWLEKAVEKAKSTDLFSSAEDANDDAVILWDAGKYYQDQEAYFEDPPIFV